MKKLILSLYLLCFTTTVLAFQCAPATPVVWQELSSGVSWTKFDLGFTPYNKENARWSTSLSRSVTVRAFKIDLAKNQLLFHSAKNDLECGGSDRYIQKLIKDQNKDAIGAINASFFVMPSGGILGLALDQNKVWSDDLTSLNKQSAGVLTIAGDEIKLTPKKDFVLRHGNVLSQTDAAKFQFAVEAYPQLLNEGNLLVDDSVLDSKRARTSIGQATSGEIILVTIDARGENLVTGMTLFEYAYMLKTKACGLEQKIALNLDGGGSSAFAIPSLNLYEQADRCRHLGNILSVVPKRH